MTDVPRRSFPLVVPPPGGFEQAVRHGRRIRRRRAGGSTGAALMLVGALAYSTMTGNGGTTGLQPTDRGIRHEATEAPGQPSQSPDPSVSPTASTSSSPDPRDVGAPHYPPASGLPDPGDISQPARPPGPGNGRAFAARNPIDEGGATRGANTQCLERAVDPWCSYASAVVESRGSGIDTYQVVRFAFTLCRSVDSGTGEVEFGTAQEVEFKAVFSSGNETVWTYSRGQAPGAADAPTSIAPGSCVEWHTYWNTYDDWGGGTSAGAYRLEANSLGASTEALPPAEETFTL